MLRPTHPPTQPPAVASGPRPASSLPAAAILLATLILAAGCATTDPAPPAPPAAPAPAADAVATPPPPADAVATPPASEHAPPAVATAAEGGEAVEEPEWILDEESGRRYHLAEVPKIEGYYMRREDGRILLPYGAVFEVVEESDTTFTVKSWEPRERSLPLAAEEEAMTDAERAAILATYPTLEGSVDRLVFEDFGRGLPPSGQWRNGFDLADMNGDGHLDIVFGPYRKSFPPQPNIYLADGTGGWNWWEARYPELTYDYGDAAAGDFDGDGNQDMVLGMHLQGMVVLLGDGAGTFREWSEGISRYSEGEPTAFSSRAVTVVDWNGDGRLDIVALGEGPSRSRTRRAGQMGALVDVSRGFLVYLNQGDGSWEAYRPVELTHENADFGDDLVLVDIDGDGLRDLVSATSRIGNTGLVVQRQSREEAALRELEGLRENALVDSLASGDLDGDGHQDVIVGYRNRAIDDWRAGVDVLWGRGDGGFERQGLWAEVSRFPVGAVGAGELDGEPGADIVALTGDGRVLVFLGDGARGFVPETSPELPEPQPGCVGFDVELHDFDGNGRDEIVVSFAGEGTGLPGLSPKLFHAGCEEQGSIQAWTPRLREAEEAQ